MEARVTALFTIGSTILPITASLLAARVDILEGAAVSRVFLILGFAFYVFLAGCFVRAFRTNRWDARPEMPRWKALTIGRPEGEMRRWLGGACVEAYGNDKRVLERKARTIGLAVWGLAGEAMCLTIAVIAPLWPVRRPW
ncbi:MAG: hypothetical protein WKF80_06120 [Thermomicrobiales bacterium]